MNQDQASPAQMTRADYLFDPDAVTLPSGSFVNGAMIAGRGEPVALVRPSDGKTMAEQSSAEADLVDQAVATARTSHKSGVWANSAPQEKARVLRRWADLIQADAPELMAREAVVSTRLATELAARDIPITAAIVRYYGEVIDKVEGKVYASRPGSWSLGVHEPYGVVAAISPWNSPLILAMAKIAPALAAGNAIVLKPSEFTPFGVTRLAELAIQAGLPAGQIAITPGVGGETGRALVTHPEVDYVSFTGSTATGRQVMSDAALAGPKPVSLEMGGKTPQVVFADADLDRAVRLIADSVVRNAGQICYAGTRLVIERRIADEVIAKVVRLIGEVEPGPTWSNRTTLAPILSKRQIERVSSILQQGLAAGAEIVVGGSVIDTAGPGFFFQPTIVRSLQVDNPIIQQEIFGPVLAVQPFDDVEEAIALADHKEYGLGAAVYTRDLAVAMKCSHAIKAGSIWVNQFGVNDVVTPVGGYKRSGFGKDFGMDGLLKYMHSKSISIQM